MEPSRTRSRIWMLVAGASTISNSAFSPQRLDGPAGTTVTRTNNEIVTHTVTAAANAGNKAIPTRLFAQTPVPEQSFSSTLTGGGVREHPAPRRFIARRRHHVDFC